MAVATRTRAVDAGADTKDANASNDTSANASTAPALSPHFNRAIGRSMLATQRFAADAIMLSEAPWVCGHCSTAGGCPGCGGGASCTSTGCSWSAALENKLTSGAVQWHAELSTRTPPPNHKNFANWVRVCCLLAVVIQAVACPSLWRSLMSGLRPAALFDDAEHPVARSTAQFACDFAERLPSVSASNLGALLLRLQTNLFYLDALTIGLFSTACQLEHSCVPNACVRACAGTDPRITIRACAEIAAGDAVSFSYISGMHRYGIVPADRAAGSGLDGLTFQERRARLRDECGFVCRCAACCDEERAWSAAGRAAARKRLAEKRAQAALHAASPD